MFWGKALIGTAVVTSKDLQKINTQLLAIARTIVLLTRYINTNQLYSENSKILLTKPNGIK